MPSIFHSYHLLDPNKLTPTEDFDAASVSILIAKILNDRRWTSPIIVHKNALFVMDGHHRLEAAKRLDLALVPVLFRDYDCVDVTAWRSGESVTPDDIFAMARSGKKFPYKTTKHILRSEAPFCSVPLTELKQPTITGYAFGHRLEDSFSTAAG